MSGLFGAWLAGIAGWQDIARYTVNLKWLAGLFFAETKILQLAVSPGEAHLAARGRCAGEAAQRFFLMHFDERRICVVSFAVDQGYSIDIEFPDYALFSVNFLAART